MVSSKTLGHGLLNIVSFDVYSDFVLNIHQKSDLLGVLILTYEIAVSFNNASRLASSGDMGRGSSSGSLRSCHRSDGLNCNELVTLVLKQVEYSLCLLSLQCALIRQLTFHLVSSEFTG